MDKTEALKRIQELLGDIYDYNPESINIWALMYLAEIKGIVDSADDWSDK